MAKDAVWSGYQRASKTTVPRTIFMASGEVGTGKTWMGLQMPGPLLVQSLDAGMEGVVDRWLEDHPDAEIYVKEYDWNPNGEDFTQEKAQEIREEILTDFDYAKRHARSILWDKETDVRSCFQYAEFGGPATGVNIKDYDKLNQRYFHLINGVKKVPGLNFGMIQSMRDEWVTSNSGAVNQNTGQRKKEMSKSGKRIRAGFDRLDELVMTELHFVRDEAAEFDDKFQIWIGKCRQNPRMMDQKIPACTFAQLGTMLVPGTNEEDWQ